MLTQRRPQDEPERLQALQQRKLLDSDQEEVFDEITDLAAVICEAPMAMITLVDGERVWFKSKVGIKEQECSRDLSFCTHAILQNELFVVPDATADERFKDNPMVIGESKIRFYAGARLVDRGGQALGTMCVLDNKPRQLRPSQRRALRVLARLVMTELDLRNSADQLQHLEVEAANLRLVKTMANRLLHEIGNAMVPLSTYQQLLPERYADPEFRQSLEIALSEGVRRVFRLINQMRHLAEEVEHALEPVALQVMLEEAYKAAVKNQGRGSSRFHFDAAACPILVNGDVAALTHAFSEIILNGLQAHPTDPEVIVRCTVKPQNGSRAEVIVDFLDNGGGFASEALEKATQPFFTTRNVGPGLGLCVARKIVEKHQGQIEILKPAEGDPGGVRIRLPILEHQVEAPEAVLVEA